MEESAQGVASLMHPCSKFDSADAPEISAKKACSQAHDQSVRLVKDLKGQGKTCRYKRRAQAGAGVRFGSRMERSSSNNVSERSAIIFRI